MALTLQELPIELLDHTLRYLPLSDLLCFARTSRMNYELSIQALTSLDLAIFPRKIHSLLAFFDASNNEEDDEEDEHHPTSKNWTRYSTLHQIGLTTPPTDRPPLSQPKTLPSPPKLQHQKHHNKSASIAPPGPQILRTQEITAQNTHATTILQTRSLTNLHSLTLRLYDLTSQLLTSTLSTHFPHLHTLTLDLSHPYIHDTTLPSHYWRTTPTTGTPIWNALAGIGSPHATTLTLTTLRSLTLIRANITSFQLRHWIEHNPDLTTLKLQLCRAVDDEFLSWLADYTAHGNGYGKLRTVRFVDCAGLTVSHSAQLRSWVRDLEYGGVKDLGFRGCKGVSESMFWDVVNGGDDEDEDDDDGELHIRIPKLVSPNGTVVRSSLEKRLNGQDEMDFEVVRRATKPGSVSPALTVSDGMMGHEMGYSGKIEVDPDLTL